MTNEKIDNWALAMLVHIHAYDDGIDGGAHGLGSLDGVYVSAEDALCILGNLKDAGYNVGGLGMERDTPTLVRDEETPARGYDRGLLVSYDDEFPEERQLCWYDESKF